jgi:integrase
MASIFKMTGKPFWYLRYKKDGVWKKSSTGLRHDSPTDTRKAKQLRAEAEAAELRPTAIVRAGWDWVPNYISDLNLSEKTTVRYHGAWSWVSMWLHEEKLELPDIRYRHVQDYIAWRLTTRHRKKASRNTAILETKLLAQVMGEAVRRELVAANPLAGLKLRRDEPKRKRCFTEEEIVRCQEALIEREEWMRVCFDIALFTGCRLRETRIPLRCIDLDAEVPTITFPSPKGGAAKAFSIPIPSALIPMFRDMKKDKRRTHTITAFPLQPSRCWQNFFKFVGIEGVSFHCLRVTKVTQMRREGVPREAAMRLVNHSSELVHQLYDRHRVQDLAAYANSGTGSLSAATPQSPTKKPFRLLKGTTGQTITSGRSGERSQSLS